MRLRRSAALCSPRKSGLLAPPVFCGIATRIRGWGGRPLLQTLRAAQALMAHPSELADGALVAWREPLLLRAPTGAIDFGLRPTPEQQLADELSWPRAHPDGRLIGPDTALKAAFELRPDQAPGRGQRQLWFLVELGQQLPAPWRSMHQISVCSPPKGCEKPRRKRWRSPQFWAGEPRTRVGFVTLGLHGDR